MKFFNLIFLILTFALTVSAQVIDSDTVQIGKSGSSGNKEIKFGSGRGAKPAIRFNTSNSKLEFSNDASIYKALGSGSGSGAGINILTNPGFEDGVSSSWTNSGGTYAAASAGNILHELIGAAFTPSAAGQFFESSAITIPQVLYGSLCMVKINYKGADANVYLTVLDGSNAEIIPSGARGVLNETTGVKEAKVYFTCPSTGSLKLRVQSTAAGAVGYYDQAVLGGSDAIQSKTPQFFGSSRWAPAVNCLWTLNQAGVGLGSTFLTPNSDSDCATPVRKGNAIAITPNLPSIRFASAPPGTYKVTINGNFTIDAQSGLIAIYDGSSIGSSRMGVLPTPLIANANTLTSVFEYTSTQSNLTFSPVINILAGSPNAAINNSETTQDETAYEIIVEYYPAGTDTVLSAKCLNPIDCENEFSMHITNSGTGANTESLDWINGFCSYTNPNWTCNFNPGVFSSQPSCVANLYAAGSGSFGTSISTVSTSQIILQTQSAGLAQQLPFSLKCSRTLSDFKPKQEIKGFFSQMLEPVAFYATQSTGQSFANITPTTVVYNVEGYDTHNAYNPATGIFTVPQAGKYRCTCQVGVGGSWGTNTLNMFLTTNPTSTFAESWLTINAVTNTYTPSVTGVENFTVGKEIYCRFMQNTGGSKSLNASAQQNFFMCEKVAN